MLNTRRHTPFLVLSVFAAATAVLVACSDSDDRLHPANPALTAEGETPAEDGTPGDPEAPPTTAGQPAGDLAPVTSRVRAPRTPTDGERLSAAGIAFTLPAGWIAESPASSMRIAQARIPGAGGDAQLAAFFFGVGGGGGVEANLQRWLSQVEVADPATVQRETIAVGSLRVTWLDAAGTLQPTGMGFGPTEPEPDSRLLGAVVEGEGGPWFLKATGPDATLGAEREAFVAMLESLTPADR